MTQGDGGGIAALHLRARLVLGTLTHGEEIVAWMSGRVGGQWALREVRKKWIV